MKVRGLKELERDLARLARQVPEVAEAEVEATGRLIEARAKANAPVDTGKLRQSITYEATSGGKGAKVTANAPYAPYIEFGTGGRVDVPDGWGDLAAAFRGRGIRSVNLPARPFLIPAYSAETRALMERLMQYLRRL
ncbi:HK97-gp10 family putative phage morphogenesis protein [Larkinella soli]|uniref:HK97-gp10 family putative phage morphogenesis protein n=1 Tax=Larkinella soli TaxID=1770527 RepID=UPI000FFB2F32|nr:HK97-gp10 family putative phage morphogenesis protein [Larkinella soli]